MQAIKRFLFGHSQYQQAADIPDKKDDDYGLHLVDQVNDLFKKNLPPYTPNNYSLYSKKIGDVAFEFRKLSIEHCTHTNHLIVAIFRTIHTQNHLDNLLEGLERAAQNSKTDERKRAIYVLRACFPDSFSTKETRSRSKHKKKDQNEINPTTGESSKSKEKLNTSVESKALDSPEGT